MRPTSQHKAFRKTAVAVLDRWTSRNAYFRSYGFQGTGPGDKIHQEAVAGTGRRVASVQPLPLLDARLPASALAGSEAAANSRR